MDDFFTELEALDKPFRPRQVGDRFTLRVPGYPRDTVLEITDVDVWSVYAYKAVRKVDIGTRMEGVEMFFFTDASFDSYFRSGECLKK